MKNEITVIIPFKNEGSEVAATIKSLKEMAYATFYIILINDGSDDGYDYSPLCNEPYVTYIQHKCTLGPAVSRNEGVSICKTEYFLLMDGHMRAETSGWDKIILSILKKQDECIYCCLTDKYVMSQDIDTNKSCTVYGMGVRLDLISLKYQWLYFSQKCADNMIYKIPCIMGASYCCSKRFWDKIHGLNGLISYGFEEQLLSLKTYIDGGSCKAICNVIFAHKFRNANNVPYSTSVSDYIYNKLFIIELLYSDELKKKAFQYAKRISDKNKFEKAMSKLIENRELIIKEKLYVKKNFLHDSNTALKKLTLNI